MSLVCRPAVDRADYQFRPSLSIAPGRFLFRYVAFLVVPLRCLFMQALLAATSLTSVTLSIGAGHYSTQCPL